MGSRENRRRGTGEGSINNSRFSTKGKVNILCRGEVGVKKHLFFFFKKKACLYCDGSDPEPRENIIQVKGEIKVLE